MHLELVYRVVSEATSHSAACTMPSPARQVPALAGPLCRASLGLLVMSAILALVRGAESCTVLRMSGPGTDVIAFRDRSMEIMSGPCRDGRPTLTGE